MRVPCPRRRLPRFNPHPARGPSATGRRWRWPQCRQWFQSSPGPWAECNTPSRTTTSASWKFQSSPGPWAECNEPVPVPDAPSSSCFNPHPARGPSATQGHAQQAGRQQVSILTRPVGRVQRKAGDYASQQLGFQSSPGPWAECNVAAIAGAVVVGGFNPHPARGPSATPGAATPPRSMRTGFNPHPARGPSATSPCPKINSVSPPKFQSSPGPWAECNAADGVIATLALSLFQSSPGPWAECNPRFDDYSMLVEFLFQSSPGPWAECNTTSPTASPSNLMVSILTRPVGRVQRR